MNTRWIPVAVVLLVIAGCAPQLAQTPYGETEAKWEEYLKETYPEWEPPQTLPPTSARSLNSQVQESNNTVPANSIELIEFEETAFTDMPTPEAPAGAFDTYTVEKGDNLWKISKKLYGSGKHWRRILEANTNLLSEPGKIKPGLELKIPRP